MEAVRLRDAIAESRLRLHFQPVVDLADGAVVGVEALARWHETDLGEVSPDRFIPLAETTGLIHGLGRWVLADACRQAAGWSQAPRAGSSVPSLAPMQMSVNVSPVQLREPGFVDDVSKALAGAGLAPERLVLEVTETAVVADVDQAARALWQLRDLGVQFALDDFGTGHSSLTLLRRLPLQVVKIDRSLIRRVAVDAQDAVLVQLVVDAAHTLGLRVCAEGVEEENQAHQLVSMGCDTGQGWLFGRPAAAVEGSSDRPAADRHWLDSPGLAPVAISGNDNLVLVAGRDLAVSYASASCRRVLGRMPSELTGLGLAEVLGRDQLPDGPVTVRLRHKDGGVRWLRGVVQPLTDAAGTVREVLCVLADVTGIVSRERELADSEALFRSAFQGAPIGIALSDFDGRLLRVNPTLARRLGRPVSELLTMSVADITHPDDLASDERNLGAIRTGNEDSHLVRKRYLHADGTAIPVEVHAASVRTADGEPYCIVAHVLTAPGTPDGSPSDSLDDTQQG
ncbi:MAG: EAL domain-containing protein [Nocardioidaceae bacterium]